MTPDDRLQLLTAAVDFAANGFSIVPIAGDGTKRAAVEWKRYQTERAGADEFGNWFIERGYEGFAIVCGAVSGNATMIELEGRAVNAGAIDQLEILARDLGCGDLWDKAHGYVQLSPSGGQHWLIRCTEPVPGNLKLARRKTSTTTIDVLAETRGEGGYFIAAPSGGTVHPTGNPWIVMKGNASTIPTLTAGELQTLLNLFRQLDEMPRDQIADTPRPITGGAGMFDETRPGDAYNDATTWADLLTPEGWTAIYTDRDGVTYWRRPGKTDGISATTGRNGADNLYVFTTSTIFDTEKAYSKFAAYALLHHRGDYTSAARALAAQGYGRKISTDIITPAGPLSTPAPQPVETYVDTETGEILTTSWEPINLGPILDGTHVTPSADLFKREDGQGLLYRGKVHSFYGESESGKSWLAQMAAAALLQDGKHVTYIDFESDATDLVDRLLALGISRHEIRAGFTYIRPEGPRNPDDPAWHNLLASRPALIVIDGVTEALTMWGGETKDNDAITRWMRQFPRTVAAATGAAVVTIDHVTKDKENRGRFAIGGQAKLATIDGAAYLIEPIEALAPGKQGSLTIRVTKDRPGAVRGASGMWRRSDRTQEAAVAVLDSSKTPIMFRLERPKTEEERMAERRDSMDIAILDRVAGSEGCSWTYLKRGIEGDEHVVRERLNDLAEASYLTISGGDKRGAAMSIYTTEKYRLKMAGQSQIGNEK